MSNWNVGNHGYIPKEKTAPAAASALAVNGRSVFYGIAVQPDGTNNVTLTLYDNTVASGTNYIIPSSIVINAGVGLATISDDDGLPVTNGIYVEVTTSGACSYQVYYDN